MLIGKVIGTVVASKKDPELEGLKLLLVKGAEPDGRTSGPVLVAADAVELDAAGSSARQTVQTKDRPVDHVVMAIVDTIEMDGQVRYDKDR